MPVLGQSPILWRVKLGVESLGIWEFNQNGAGVGPVTLLDRRRLVHGQQLAAILKISMNPC
jgi:hypothetical protein